MATMTIEEFGGTGASGGKLQIPKYPPLAVQKITFTGTSAASAALQSDTTFVNIQLDTAGHVQVAASPTATTSTSRKYPADTVTFIGISSGMKIAAITA